MARQHLNGVFKDFEKLVVTKLAGPHRGPEKLAAVLAEAEFVSEEHCDIGYDLTVRHPALPVEREVSNYPILSGIIDGVACGFIVFLMDGELTIECHSWAAADIPPDVRERGLQIE